MRELDTNPVSLAFTGTILGVIHGITVWLSSDANTRTISFILTGNPYTLMYWCAGFIDVVAVFGVVSAIWWYPWIERKIMDRAERRDKE